MGLRTKDIAARFKELLADYDAIPAGAVATRYTRKCRLDEVESMLAQSLAPLHLSALALLRNQTALTSRGLADELGIEINHASNILRDLFDYGLAERFLPHQDPFLLQEHQDLMGYPGHIYRIWNYADKHREIGANAGES